MAETNMDLVRLLAVVAAALSFVGSTFILASFIRFKDLRQSFMNKLVFMVAIADFFACLSYISLSLSLYLHPYSSLSLW
ncbi:hypothetical protein KIPB_012882 [Kipferlia bialata]|uniref:Uncharacterized protein n=1 Tax=Kipferlia bialata TaxID=797122 RepID=A0A9K3DA42_9EUKA|nr:hypothetical protein KIPB_012882 [Kipferlia bialata]|eukprot:g12882.t1